MDYFAAVRYFEEFEKRIPRAEMEKMEVKKHLHTCYLPIRFLFSFLTLCVCTLCSSLDSYPWRVEGDRLRIYWNNLWKLQER